MRKLSTLDENTAVLFKPVPVFHLLVPLVAALLSLALSAYASYNTSDKTTSNRVTAVEVRQSAVIDAQRDHDADIMRRLDRIENKLDAVLSADILRNNRNR